MRQLAPTALALALTLAGCAGPPKVAELPTPTASASVAVAAPYAGALPAYAGAAEVAEVYRWAGPNRQVLQYFPCVCGCEGAGHQNNWNCFASDVKPDGEIVWDAHGAACGACQAIARDVRELIEAGEPLPAIRDFVDKRYGPTRMNPPRPPA